MHISIQLVCSIIKIVRQLYLGFILCTAQFENIPDGLHEHAEGGMLAGDGQEAQDDGEVAEDDDRFIARLRVHN